MESGDVFHSIEDIEKAINSYVSWKSLSYLDKFVDFSKFKNAEILKFNIGNLVNKFKYLIVKETPFNNEVEIHIDYTFKGVKSEVITINPLDPVFKDLPEYLTCKDIMYRSDIEKYIIEYINDLIDIGEFMVDNDLDEVDISTTFLNVDILVNKFLYLIKNNG